MGILASEEKKTEQVRIPITPSRRAMMERIKTVTGMSFARQGRKALDLFLAEAAKELSLDDNTLENS